MITTRPDAAPDQPASTGPRGSGSEPVLPESSPEDTDAHTAAVTVGRSAVR